MNSSIFFATPPTVPIDLPPIMPIEVDISHLEKKISEKWGLASFSIEKEEPFWEEACKNFFLEKKEVSFFKLFGKSIYGGGVVPENLLLNLLSRMTNLDISQVYKGLLEPFYTTIVLQLKEFIKNTAGQNIELDFLGALPQEEREGPFLVCPFKIRLDIDHVFEVFLFFSEKSVREVQKNAWRQEIWNGIIRKDTCLELSLELGCVYLEPSEWRVLSEGDFILPDLLMWNPESDKYKVRVCHLNQALFRARLKKNGTLKILDRGVDWKVFYETSYKKVLEEGVMLENEQVDEDMDLGQDLVNDSEFLEENSSHINEEEGFQDGVEDAEELYAANEQEEIKIPEKILFNEMPVQIRFEVGRIELPIEKIEALVPGEILKVDQSVLGQVQMVVGNRIIGLGEVVSFQGKPAIRVLRFG